MDKNEPTSDLKLDQHSVWSGMAGSIVALIMTTILSMHQASSKTGVNIEPALEILLNKFSQDANNFLATLNRFCQVASQTDGLNDRTDRLERDRTDRTKERCSPCCSCDSSGSDDCDCESVEEQTELTCVCDDAEEHPSVVPKESAEVEKAVQVCIVEEEFTEFATYTVDPVTNKVKITKIEELSQLAKLLNKPLNQPYERSAEGDRADVPVKKDSTGLTGREIPVSFETGQENDKTILSELSEEPVSEVGETFPSETGDNIVTTPGEIFPFAGPTGSPIKITERPLETIEELPMPKRTGSPSKLDTLPEEESFLAYRTGSLSTLPEEEASYATSTGSPSKLDKLPERVSSFAERTESATRLDKLPEQVSSFAERTESATRLDKLPEQVSSFAERTDSATRLDKLPEQVSSFAKRTESPTKLDKLPEQVSSFAKDTESPTKLYKSPEKVSSFAKRTESPTKFDKLPEQVSSFAKCTESPTKLDKSPEQVSSFTKDTKSPSKLDELPGIIPSSVKRTGSPSKLDKLAKEVYSFPKRYSSPSSISKLPSSKATSKSSVKSGEPKRSSAKRTSSPDKITQKPSDESKRKSSKRASSASVIAELTELVSNPVPKRKDSGKTLEGRPKSPSTSKHGSKKEKLLSPSFVETEEKFITSISKGSVNFLELTEKSIRKTSEHRSKRTSGDKRALTSKERVDSIVLPGKTPSKASEDRSKKAGGDERTLSSKESIEPLEVEKPTKITPADRPKRISIDELKLSSKERSAELPEELSKKAYGDQMKKTGVDECVCTSSPEDGFVPPFQDAQLKMWAERLSLTEQTLAALRVKIAMLSSAFKQQNVCSTTRSPYTKIDASQPVPKQPEIRTRPERLPCPAPAVSPFACQQPCKCPGYADRNHSCCTKDASPNKSSSKGCSSISLQQLPLMPREAIPVQPGYLANNSQRFDFKPIISRTRTRSSKADSCACGPTKFTK